MQVKSGIIFSGLVTEDEAGLWLGNDSPLEIQTAVLNWIRNSIDRELTITIEETLDK